MKHGALIALAALLATANGATSVTAAEPLPVARTWPLPPLHVVVPGSLLVRSRDGVAIELPGAHRVATLADGRERWDFEGTAEETIGRRDALAHDHPDLEVELDLWRTAQTVPNDDRYPKQWALKLLNAEAAWKVTTGDNALTVAVVDTGYVDHPDLVDRIVPGYDFITDPSLAGDGDGRDADPHDAGDESEASSSFHGTHVSGIIGASTNNHDGMAGTDWSCRIQPVRVLGVRAHRGKDSDIADGIRWAAGYMVPGYPQNKTPARVINLSFGGPGFSRVLQDAVLAAQARGVLVVGSAGNDGQDARSNVPGALEGVLSVAAAGPDGKLASYSNFGPRVDVMTPGGALFLDTPTGMDTPGAILSTSFVREQRQPVFAYAAGTSQAAAYATGVAALVRAAAPSLPPQVVAAVMRRASTVPNEGCESGCGAGLVDAAKAVTFAKAIEAAECGEAGCGKSNVLPPVPLRPEEGCGVGAGGSAGWWLVVAAIALHRLRGRRLLLALFCGCALFGCSTAADDRESSSQSSEPLTVKIVDPIPTYDEGDLSITIGPSGRTIEAQVTPSNAIDRVELELADPEQTIGRLGHAPFRFFVPAWAAEAEGGRMLCVVAHDAHGRDGKTCFRALP